MGFLNVIGIAFGLAMDAFAVAVSASVVLGKVSARQTFRLSFHFGFFQAMMPVVGWLAGSTITRWVEAYSHWIAFGLLVAVGGKMIFEALRKKGVEGDPTRGMSLVALSVATSIDALAVGVSFAMVEVTIWWPCLVIGLVAAAMTVVGLHVGSYLGTRFGSRMGIVGGVVLVAIGIRILVQ